MGRRGEAGTDHEVRRYRVAGRARAQGGGSAGPAGRGPHGQGVRQVRRGEARGEPGAWVGRRGPKRGAHYSGRVALLLVPEEAVSPGILGFMVVFAIGLALFFLIRSMNRHIGRIQAPREADIEQAEWERRQAARRRSGDPDAGGDAETDAAAAGDGTGAAGARGTGSSGAATSDEGTAGEEASGGRGRGDDEPGGGTSGGAEDAPR